MTIRNRLIKAQIVTAVGVALLAPVFSDAATLGRMTVQSGRNEPLRAEIQVMQIDAREATSLSVRIGSRAAHEKARLPYPEEAAKLEASIARKPDGGYVVVLRSREMITEPMLDVLVELKSPLSEVARPYLIDTSAEGSARGGGEALRGDSATRPESLLRTEAIVRGDPVPSRPEAPASPPAAIPPAAASPVPAAPPVAAPARVAPAVVPPVAAVAASPAAPVAQATGTQSAATARGAGATAAEGAATASDSIAVAKGDTLATIAARAKADEVSLDRAMLAIFRANQQAFFGSIHQLKSDQTLRIPSRETMLGEPDAFIARELRRHSEIFRNYKAQVAGSVPLAGNPSTKPGRDAPVAGTEKYDRLVLSKGAGNLSTDEQRAAAESALREADSRITELQRNINDLKRLAALKDRQIAEASAQLKTLAADRSAGSASGSLQPTSAAGGGSSIQAESNGASSSGPAVLPNSLQPTAATVSPAAAAMNAASTTTPDAAAPSANTTTGRGASSDTAKDEPKVSLAPATPEPIKRVDPPAALRTEADSSLSSYWIYGGVVLLVLLIGFLIRRSRQRKEAQAALEDDPHSLFGDSVELDSRMNQAANTVSGKSNETKNPQVVPVN